MSHDQVGGLCLPVDVSVASYYWLIYTSSFVSSFSWNSRFITKYNFSIDQPLLTFADPCPTLIATIDSLQDSLFHSSSLSSLLVT